MNRHRRLTHHKHLKARAGCDHHKVAHPIFHGMCFEADALHPFKQLTTRQLPHQMARIRQMVRPIIQEHALIRSAVSQSMAELDGDRQTAGVCVLSLINQTIGAVVYRGELKVRTHAWAPFSASCCRMLRVNHGSILWGWGNADWAVLANCLPSI